MSKKKIGLPVEESAKPVLSLFRKVVGVIGKVTNILITAPLYLPPQFLKAVKYLSLLAGLIKAAEQEPTEDE